MRKQQQYRQGDVLITNTKTDRIPTGPKTEGPIVLAEGETTGHAHRLKAERDQADWWKGDGEQQIVIKSSATVVHEEHGPIPLKRGTYRVRRQSEYSPAEIRLVTD